jgi:hypothetical protein
MTRHAPATAAQTSDAPRTEPNAADLDRAKARVGAARRAREARRQGREAEQATSISDQLDAYWQQYEAGHPRALKKALYLCLATGTVVPKEIAQALIAREKLAPPTRMGRHSRHEQAAIDWHRKQAIVEAAELIEAKGARKWELVCEVLEEYSKDYRVAASVKPNSAKTIYYACIKKGLPRNPQIRASLRSVIRNLPNLTRASIVIRVCG